MKRIFIFIGIMSVLIGIAIILPALANYGRPGPVASNALTALLLGSLVTVAGAGGMVHGIRNHKS